VGLPVDGGLAVCHLQLLGEAEQWPTQQFGKLGGHRARRAVGALGAADDEIELLPFDGAGNRPRGAERVRVLQFWVRHQDAAVGPHGQASADRLQRPRRSHRDEGHLARILFNQLKPGFHSVLVARVENEVTLPDEPLGAWIELAGRIGIGDLLDAHEHVHGWLQSLWRNSPLSNGCLYYDRSPKWDEPSTSRSCRNRP